MSTHYILSPCASLLLQGHCGSELPPDMQRVGPRGQDRRLRDGPGHLQVRCKRTSDDEAFRGPRLYLWLEMDPEVKEVLGPKKIKTNVKAKTPLETRTRWNTQSNAATQNPLPRCLCKSLFRWSGSGGAAAAAAVCSASERDVQRSVRRPLA